MSLQKIKSNQEGIAHLGAILVVIVVLAISGASYLVYQRQNEANDPSSGLVSEEEENADENSDNPGEEDEENQLAQEAEESTNAEESTGAEQQTQ